MKQTASILIAILFLFASCGKDSKNEWSRFYGFTQADIVGHYESNPDESLYEELPTAGITVYDNVTIDIGAVGSTAVSLHIVIPGKINKTFSGTINTNDDHHSDLVLNNGNNEDVMMTVYKNEDGRVRFHGRVKHYYYNADNELVNSINWGFDVVKEDASFVGSILRMQMN